MLFPVPADKLAALTNNVNTAITAKIRFFIEFLLFTKLLSSDQILMIFILKHKNKIDDFGITLQKLYYFLTFLLFFYLFSVEYNYRNISRGVNMDFFAIGKKIKELRVLMGLSQKELAEDICTQAQISKIEQGIVYPYATTLYLISQRLGVDVNYFFDIGTTPRLDYVQEVARQLKLARRNINYTEMLEIVQAEEKNPLFTNNRLNLQLLLWHKGICAYHIKKDMIRAFQILDEAISLTSVGGKITAEREIEITLSKGVIYFEEDQLEKAGKIYKFAKQSLRQLPHIQDVTIKSRLYYNAARTLTREQNYEQSIVYCKEAIDWCIKQDNQYLFGELHYQIGYNYELQKENHLAREYMEKALIIFQLQKDDKYTTFIQKKLLSLS